jgi:hypothetical protein
VNGKARPRGLVSPKTLYPVFVGDWNPEPWSLRDEKTVKGIAMVEV